MALLSIERAFWTIGTCPKFSPICPPPYVKFDEEYDGDAPEPVLPTVLELWPNFVQNWPL